MRSGRPCRVISASLLPRGNLLYLISTTCSRSSRSQCWYSANSVSADTHSIQYHVAQILLHRPWVAYDVTDQIHSPQTNNADQWSTCVASALHVVRYLKAFHAHYGLACGTCDASKHEGMTSISNIPPAF